MTRKCTFAADVDVGAVVARLPVQSTSRCRGARAGEFCANAEFFFLFASDADIAGVCRRAVMAAVKDIITTTQEKGLTADGCRDGQPAVVLNNQHFVMAFEG